MFLAYKNSRVLRSEASTKAQISIGNVLKPPIKSKSSEQRLVEASALSGFGNEVWDKKSKTRPPFGTDGQLELGAVVKAKEQVVTGCRVGVFVDACLQYSRDPANRKVSPSIGPLSIMIEHLTTSYFSVSYSSKASSRSFVVTL